MAPGLFGAASMALMPVRHERGTSARQAVQVRKHHLLWGVIHGTALIPMPAIPWAWPSSRLCVVHGASGHIGHHPGPNTTHQNMNPPQKEVDWTGLGLQVPVAAGEHLAANRSTTGPHGVQSAPPTPTSPGPDVNPH